MMGHEKLGFIFCLRKSPIEFIGIKLIFFLILRQTPDQVPAVTHLVPNSFGPQSHLVPMDKWSQSIWSPKTIGPQDNWSPWTNGPHHIWSPWTSGPQISIIICSLLNAYNFLKNYIKEKICLSTGFIAKFKVIISLSGRKYL